MDIIFQREGDYYAPDERSGSLSSVWPHQVKRSNPFLSEMIFFLSNETYNRLDWPPLSPPSSFSRMAVLPSFISKLKRGPLLSSRLVGRSHRLGYEEDEMTKRSPTQSARGLWEKGWYQERGVREREGEREGAKRGIVG